MDSAAILASRNGTAADYVDPVELAPIGVTWQLSRRDLADYLTGMSWFTALLPAQRTII